MHAVFRSVATRVTLSLLLGLGIALQPLLFQTHPSWWPSSRHDATLQYVLDTTGLPGYIGAAILTRDVRTNSFAFLGVNTLFYGLLTFGVFAVAIRKYKK